MQVRLISQLGLGSVQTRRVGDELLKALIDPRYSNFRFAVAYMRMSGWSRLTGGVQALLGRGGQIAGAVGIDDGVTSVEALEALLTASAMSTVFYTVSSPIYHPKIYLFDGPADALAIIGSANLTADGLFRNVEAAVEIELDLNLQPDLDLHSELSATVDELLDTTHANVQPISSVLQTQLETAGLIQREAQLVRTATGPNKSTATSVLGLFPSLSVRPAPPTATASIAAISSSAGVTSPTTVAAATTFLMQLSHNDCSKRTGGTAGTPEIYIPRDAVPFFPPLPSAPTAGRTHPDTYFNVVVNDPSGLQFVKNYRFWFYQPSTDWRLNVGHATTDLTNPGGGDLLVIDKLPAGVDPAYEVTIVSSSDPSFNNLLAHCSFTSQGKKWGVL